jgi:hypothetical protein
MTSKFTLTILSLCVVIAAHSQITLTSANMPAAGWTQGIAIDSTPSSVNFGSAGTNQVYNFSNLAATTNDTLFYSAPTDNQLLAFPNANLALTSDNVNYIFIDNSSAGFSYQGAIGTTSGVSGNVNFSPVEPVYQFPVAYGDNFSGNWGFRKAVTGASVGESGFDSIILTYTDTLFDTIDGWGTVTTPIGSYNGLRDARRDFTHTTLVAMKINPPESILVENNFDTTLEFTYLATETKGPLVSFDYDTAGHVVNAKYSLIPASTGIAPVTLSGISIYPNPANQSVIIDMRNNHDLITADYNAVGIYNLMGEKVRTIPQSGFSRVATITVGDLPAGMYFAAIASNSAMNVLGKFIVVH